MEQASDVFRMVRRVFDGPRSARGPRGRRVVATAWIRGYRRCVHVEIVEGLGNVRAVDAGGRRRATGSRAKRAGLASQRATLRRAAGHAERVASAHCEIRQSTDEGMATKPEEPTAAAASRPSKLRSSSSSHRVSRRLPRSRTRMLRRDHQTRSLQTQKNCSAYRGSLQHAEGLDLSLRRRGRPRRA